MKPASHAKNLHSTATATRDQRLEWVTPQIQKMEAGDAEGAIILGAEVVVLLS